MLKAANSFPSSSGFICNIHLEYGFYFEGLRADVSDKQYKLVVCGNYYILYSTVL